jgi:signal peptidase I
MLLRLLVFLAVIVGIVAAAFFGLTQRYAVPNDAMEPTLQEGDDVAVLRFEGTFDAPHRKDVVVVEPEPTGACFSKSYVVRIIGLPGETVSERDGAVSVDGRPLQEPYVRSHRPNGVSRTLHVPPDSYLVLGDNRASSCSSPGFVLKKNVVGTVSLTYWPVDRVSFG